MPALSSSLGHCQSPVFSKYKLDIHPECSRYETCCQEFSNMVLSAIQESNTSSRKEYFFSDTFDTSILTRNNDNVHLRNYC